MNSERFFKAFLVTKNERGKFSSAIVERKISDLPEGDVLIKVAYSSLNYKDALSATGVYGVTKNYPHVPGIDAAGYVVSSHNSNFTKDDPVIVTGYELGSNHDGGYSEYIRVPEEWVVPLPENMELKESMIIGTAGFTAAISVQTILQNGLSPDTSEMVVTGASGGVGSFAVAILAKLGFRVVASTGKKQAHNYLKSLGAHKVIGRSELIEQSDSPLLPAKWTGGVDTVGGQTLATLIKSTKNQGCIAACGVVGGNKLPLTVYPFILRGVRLLGIDSAHWPMPLRLNAWYKLATEWKIENLDTIAQEIHLKDLNNYVSKILAGEVSGRIVIKL